MNTNKPTEQTQPTTTKQETVIEQLRDLALEDLDVVTGGNAARCDNNIAQTLA